VKKKKATFQKSLIFPNKKGRKRLKKGEGVYRFTEAGGGEKREFFLQVGGNKCHQRLSLAYIPYRTMEGNKKGKEECQRIDGEGGSSSEIPSGYQKGKKKIFLEKRNEKLTVKTNVLLKKRDKEKRNRS